MLDLTVTHAVISSMPRLLIPSAGDTMTGERFTAEADPVIAHGEPVMRRIGLT